MRKVVRYRYSIILEKIDRPASEAIIGVNRWGAKLIVERVTGFFTRASILRESNAARSCILGYRILSRQSVDAEFDKSWLKAQPCLGPVPSNYGTVDTTDFTLVPRTSSSEPERKIVNFHSRAGVSIAHSRGEARADGPIHPLIAGTR